MNSLKLIEPSAEFEAEHSAMLSEWHIAAEKLVPFTLKVLQRETGEWSN